jgi:hypothetical protein
MSKKKTTPDLLKDLFGSVVVVAFQSVFCAKMH